MRYVLLMSDDETWQPGPSEIDVMPEFASWFAFLEERGVTHNGVRLRPSGDATTVRQRADEVLVTDGPFAETKDQIGGFEIIECQDLDEAIEVAARHPTAAIGRVEVRPIWEQ